MKFRDPEMVQRLRERLESIADTSLAWLFEHGFDQCASPDQAAINLERWLGATSSPATYLGLLIGHQAHLLIAILGASQPVADCLIQNPELASLIFDPIESLRKPSRIEIEREGDVLIKSASSYAHTMDRLRFLRQRWNLTTVLNDLGGTWSQPDTWLAISEIADALIALAYRSTWAHFAKERGLDYPCPVTVVGFGKLAGCELNYSSDIDLVYVLPEDLSEIREREASRFCESFGRAISDRMGRGMLYRVDLRLRPYGAAGPIAPSMRAVETYYDRYAEPWEIQALLRSRPIVGDPSIFSRWERLRTRTCFRPRTAESAIEAMLSMRERIEASAAAHDIKRGKGGIRDIEFLAQILQLVHGHAVPTIRESNTIDLLFNLEEAQLLAPDSSCFLREAYEFLRKLEHRIQLLNDQQTHELPNDPPVLACIANLMGLSDSETLLTTLETVRAKVHATYVNVIGMSSPFKTQRERYLQLGGPSESVVNWIDHFSEAEALYSLLIESRDARSRVETLARRAPRLIADFELSESMTELALSGELEEDFDSTARIGALNAKSDPQKVAVVAQQTLGRVTARWLLTNGDDTGPAFCSAFDSLLNLCCPPSATGLEVFALGSFGNLELGPRSDLDVLLLVPDSGQQQQAEAEAQRLLSNFRKLRQFGLHVNVDLRLRPDGSKGLLARSHTGLLNYDLEGMEMWERFALGHARPIRAGKEGLRVVRKCAYGLPLTPERLHELTEMKKRIEAERIPSHLRTRHVKLGHGGLNDIEWTVHLLEMRYPNAAAAGTKYLISDRIHNVGRAGLLNVIEVEQLLIAHAHLAKLRTLLYLLMVDDDVLPENPEKLDRLAEGFSLASGNEFLSVHRSITECTRSIFIETLARLRA